MNFPKPQFNRPTSRASKAEIQEQFNLPQVYRMSFNESAYGPSPNVVAALQAAAAQIGDYPDFGDEVLRHALAEVWGRGLTPDYFFTGSSGFDTVELVTRAFLQAGDEVLISPPTFGIYAKLAAQEGATAVSVPLRQPSFTPDVDGLLTAVTERTRLLILCNPNNPTGTIMPAADMERLVNNLPDHVIIVADEVYRHFVTDPDYPDTLAYILAGKPIIMIQSFSKAYGMAGMRLGYAIAPPAIANYVAGFMRGFHHNHLALVAGVTALRDPDHLQKNIDAALTGKAYLMAQFDRLGLAYLPSQTNFIVVKLPASHNAAAVADALLPFGVMVRPLKDEGLENCLRVSVSTPAGNEQFIRGLEKVIWGD